MSKNWWWFSGFCVLLLFVFLGRPTSQKNLDENASAVAYFTSQQTFYSTVDNDCRVMKSVSDIASDPVVKTWQKDLPLLRPYLEAQLPLLKNKTLNVVLQLHPEAVSGRTNKQIVESQKFVLATLQQLQPQLLTVEGSYSDRWSKQAAMDEIDRNSAEMSEFQGGSLFPETDAQKEEDFVEISTNNSVMSYALKNPACHTIGGEWRGLHTLDVIMMLPGAPRQAQAAIYNGSRLRSWLTAARVSDFMVRDGLTEATIVIGSDHRRDFEQLPHLFGVKVNFYEMH